MDKYLTVMNNQTPKNTEENGRDNKGRFAKGNSGKPKGAKNTTTKEVKELISDFLSDKASELPEIWEHMNEQERATLFIHLAKMVVPRPTPQNDNKNKDVPIFNIPPLPDIANRQLTAQEAAEIAKELDDEY